MDDALSKAEDDGGDDQPAAPQEQCSARPVGARSSPARPDAAEEREQRGRKQPRGLAAHQIVEQAQRAGCTTEASATPTPARTAASEDASEPVVAEDQVEDAVVGRAVDHGARTGWP